MARLKLGIQFDGFDQTLKHLEAMNRGVKQPVETALKQSHQIVVQSVEQAITASPYDFNRTGTTKGSLRESPEIEWDGTNAICPVGFDISHGGLPSIFLMYGTPRITPDRKLYNSIFGKSVRNKVSEAQARIFQEYIQEARKHG